MKKYSLNEMKLGWFIGDFEPSVQRTKDFEVAIKNYPAGTREDSHFHKKANEITVIVSGRVKMNDSIFETGDIIVIEKNENTDFTAITDTVTCVIKTPSVIGDKFKTSAD